MNMIAKRLSVLQLKNTTSAFKPLLHQEGRRQVLRPELVRPAEGVQLKMRHRRLVARHRDRGLSAGVLGQGRRRQREQGQQPAREPARVCDERVGGALLVHAGQLDVHGVR